MRLKKPQGRPKGTHDLIKELALLTGTTWPDLEEAGHASDVCPETIRQWYLGGILSPRIHNIQKVFNAYDYDIIITAVVVRRKRNGSKR